MVVQRALLIPNYRCLKPILKLFPRIFVFHFILFQQFHTATKKKRIMVWVIDAHILTPLHSSSPYNIHDKNRSNASTNIKGKQCACVSVCESSVQNNRDNVFGSHSQHNFNDKNYCFYYTYLMSIVCTAHTQNGIFIFIFMRCVPNGKKRRAIIHKQAHGIHCRPYVVCVCVCAECVALTIKLNSSNIIYIIFVIWWLWNRRPVPNANRKRASEHASTRAHYAKSYGILWKRNTRSKRSNEKRHTSIDMLQSCCSIS